MLPPKILYIHGASASHLSFEFIRQQLPIHTGLPINYSVETSVATNIKNIKKSCNECFGDNQFSIIAHSMGGLIALKLLQDKKLNIKKLLTLATPFNGHYFAEYLKWIFPSYKLYEDIAPSSKFIKDIQKAKFSQPIRSIVATNGYIPVFRQPNDGTVTVESQLSLNDPEFFEINLCHYEILLSKDVINNIEEFLFTTNSQSIIIKRS